MIKKVIIMLCAIFMPLGVAGCGLLFHQHIERIDAGAPETRVLEGDELVRFGARYLFEQTAFPVNLYLYEDDVIYHLRASIFVSSQDVPAELLEVLHYVSVDFMQLFVYHVWEEAASAFFSGMMHRGFREWLGIDQQRIAELENYTRYDFDLGDEHIIEVSIVDIDTYTSAFIIKLLDMDTALLSTYIGIAYNETMGLRMFTLEQTDYVRGDPLQHVFCFVATDSRGSFHMIENNSEMFIAGIRDAMNGLIETAEGGAWLEH